ncbi:MAG TPA: hypothetical protein VNH11_11355 [Pirellulales bacterium]|nr:hypothetical protein [Pirellulales bacterium]
MADDTDEFVTQIGRAQKAGDKRSVTFVRVIHKTTGKERLVTGIGNERALAVEARLIQEIRKELGSGD